MGASRQKRMTDMILRLIISLAALASTAESWAPYRLPSHLSPEHYSLKVITHLDENNFMFEGSVTIRVRCLEPGSNVTVHVKDPLRVDHGGVKIREMVDEDGKDLTIASHKLDAENDFYVIGLSDELQPGMTYIVHIPFQGTLTQLLAGYYRSSYVDLATGETRWLASTQFEPTDARRAFPCFDEPAMKARFSVSLGRQMDRNLTSISNMPLRVTEPMKQKPGWVWDHFKESVPMSTYLVAFIVCDFEYRMSKPLDPPHNQVQFRIWARRDAMDQVELAADIGPKALSFFEKYYDVPYPLPKQDMIAIPDFNSGAMENWGLITYRETTLLHDPMVSTIQSKQSVISVIAHELAHQWFGNLVTMKWWTDLWLNEGFATYAAALASNNIMPEWGLKDENAVEGYMIVTALDSLKSSHPVSVPIGHPSEILQIFDTISYKKGSFILRMMNLFLGENSFRKGVSSYLEANKFKNAEQDDLWASLTAQAHRDGTLPSNLNVKDIMDTWTLQTGFPIVTVTRNYENGTALVTQERFFGIKYFRDPLVRWWVPLSFTTQDELNFDATVPKQWMPKEFSTEVTGLPDSNKWVIFNMQAAGLYRVNYDQENWKMIIDTFNSDEFHKIHVVNRAQIIDDVINLARVGKLRYELVFDLLNYLKREKHYLPWRAALRNMAYLDNMLRRTGEYGAFKKFMKMLLTPLYEEISKMDVGHELFDVKHRQQIIGWACSFDIGDCVSQALIAFKAWKNQTDPDSNNPIASNLRSVIYCSAIRHGDEDDWDFAWERYKKSNVASEKAVILGSMGCSQEEWLLRRYLQWATDENSGIKRQDTFSAFASVSRGTIGYHIAASYLKNHHEELFAFYGPKAIRLGRYFSALGSHVNTMAEYNEWKALGEEKTFLPSKLIVGQTEEAMLNNIDWRTNYLTEINQLLKKKLKEEF